MKFILLAAGKSSRFYKRVKKNKCLINFRGTSLIKHTLKEVKKAKVKDITVVVGFNAKKIKKHLMDHKDIKYIYNKKYNSREMLYSLVLALKRNKADAIVGYSDVIISEKVIKNIVQKNKNEITLPVLKNWKKVWKTRGKDPLVDAETLIMNKRKELKSIGEKIKNLQKIKYQFMGIIFIPKSKIHLILKKYKIFQKNRKLHLTSFINKLLNYNIKINCQVTKEPWYEFDDYQDYLNFRKSNLMKP